MNPATKVVLRYIFPSEVEVASDVTIVRSDSHLPAWLRDANPGGWHPIEWDELLDGRLGPWAMVVDCERVISIAHTPVPMTDEVAECGVWTKPGSRGRGHATASASMWAEVLRPSGRRLVYRTTEDNLSSRRVAERLRLRLVSRTEEPRDDHVSNLHPLSSVRQVSE
ncbi:MAG: GNAT family protein [Myxococcota bacterium]